MSSQSYLDLSLSLCLNNVGSTLNTNSNQPVAAASSNNGGEIHLQSTSLSTSELPRGIDSNLSRGNESKFSRGNESEFSRGNELSFSEGIESDLSRSFQLAEAYFDLHRSNEMESAQANSRQNLCNSKRPHKVMSDDEREDCINTLLSKQTDLKLPHGVVNEVAAQFGVSRWTIQRIWKEIKRLIAQRKRIIITCNFKGRAGRKRLQLDYDQVMNTPLRRRTTVRALAAAININKSTVHRFIKWGQLKRHSNSMKPGLTDLNVMQRLRWCISNVIPSTINTIPKFQYLYNVVHIDEKWFFMSQATQNFYLAPNELHPYRTCKHKSHINKLMFMVAVARPWFSEEGDEIFDGKIGVFPLVTKEPAKRTSKYRDAGTMETKPIKKITKEVIRQKFIHELIPAIKAKWPLEACGTIWIQLDNAPPHMGFTDAEFNNAANSDGFHFHILPQPPNSPDLNVLDLGFFRAIQAIQNQVAPKIVDDLISAVEHAFDVFEPRLLNYVFLTYQYVMLEVMKVRGSNNYKLPHYGKGRMEREGNLPETVEVPQDILQECASDLIKQYLALQHADERGTDIDENLDDLHHENIVDAQVEDEVGNEYYTIPTGDTEDEDEDEQMHTQPYKEQQTMNFVELDLLRHFT